MGRNRRDKGSPSSVLGARRVGHGLAVGAMVGAVALITAACGSSTNRPSSVSTSGFYGTLPAAGTAKTGGVISIGQVKGDTPTYASPVTPTDDNTVYTVDEFVDLYNQPVYWSPEGDTEEVDSALSMAAAPTFSDGDKTVTIKLKSWQWSTGDPVTADNVIAFIDIAKAAVKESSANFFDYSPGLFPSNIATATAPNSHTVVLTLTKRSNPGYFYEDQLNELHALPTQWMVDKAGGPTLDYADPTDAKRIYDYLNKEASDVSTIGTDPLFKISDGSMELTSFNATTADYTMKPNLDYGGPQTAKFSELKVETFTTSQAEFNEMEAGGLDIGSVDQSDLPAKSALTAKGYSVFGVPSYSFYGAWINFKDKTGDFDKIISQLYVREALYELMNQSGEISGIWKGAAVSDYSTIATVPKTPYAPADASRSPYPYDPTKAAKLLAGHGWKEVGGTMTCERAGTSSSECGTGIPKGTKLAFTWDYTSSPVEIGQESTAFASEARTIGIKVALNEQTFDTMVADEDDPSAPSYDNKWAVSDFGGYSSELYPTTVTLFNIGGGENLGDYESTEATRLIDDSAYGSKESAVTAEASYLGKNLPIFYQPKPDYLYAVKDTVGGTRDSWLSLTQFFLTPEYWYTTTKS